MNKNIRTGILALLLVLPVLILLFLYKFGDNKFKIPVFHATDSTIVHGSYVVTKADQIPDFKFTTNQGDTLSNKDLANSIYVADFFFTKCPSICKDMSSQLMRVQESFKGDNRVKILSFTVDPIRDSPDVLNEYAKNYRAIPGKWIFLTGAKDSLYSLAKNGFRLNALQDKGSVEELRMHRILFWLTSKGGSEVIILERIKKR